MICRQCQELMSDYVDGVLELGEQSKVEQHLANCEPCRAVRDDLLQIVHFSNQLPLHTPSTTVWNRIQADLVEERKQSGLWSQFASWWKRAEHRYFNLSVPQIAAAAAAVAVVIAVTVALSRREVITPANQVASTVPASDVNLTRELLSAPDLDQIKQIEHRIDDLTETVERRKASWSPELRASFDRNMVSLDQSLLESREQWRTNPSDEFCRELLLNAYREKVRLLESFERF